MTRRMLRGSILKNMMMIAGFLMAWACVQTPVAQAQHFGGGHAGGGVAPRVGAAPISHGPIVARGPMMRPGFAPSPFVGAFTTRSLFVGRPFGAFGSFFPFYGNPFFFGRPYFYGYASAWRFNLCWWCDLWWMWGIGYRTVPFYEYGNYMPQPYVYSYTYSYALTYGEERPELPQLYLKDGTVLNVMDYWVVKGELHLRMNENGRITEQVIPYSDLDEQKTKEMAEARGFLFVVRDEPVEEYLKHHPDLK
jgi:hypothetical protein